jgi:hypothetical protein
METMSALKPEASVLTNLFYHSPRFQPWAMINLRAMIKPRQDGNHERIETGGQCSNEFILLAHGFNRGLIRMAVIWK